LPLEGAKSSLTEKLQVVLITAEVAAEIDRKEVLLPWADASLSFNTPSSTVNALVSPIQEGLLVKSPSLKLSIN